MWNTRSSDHFSTVAEYSIVRDIVRARTGRQWCLFIDRDGVINRQVVGDYVRSWADFEWLPGAATAVGELLQWAPYVVIATNQQGISKGLMSVDDVADIHRHIQMATSRNSLEINAFQVCPHLESDHCPCRKPQPGLLLEWLDHHPDVDPALSVMVGDGASDIALARNVATLTGGCIGVHIGPPADSVVGAAAISFNSLREFTSAVISVAEELR